MMANQGEIRVSPEDHGAVATCQPLMAGFHPFLPLAEWQHSTQSCH